jgi:hypothetical protein
LEKWSDTFHDNFLERIEEAGTQFGFCLNVMGMICKLSITNRNGEENSDLKDIWYKESIGLKAVTCQGNNQKKKRYFSQSTASTTTKKN